MATTKPDRRQTLADIDRRLTVQANLPASWRDRARIDELLDARLALMPPLLVHLLQARDLVRRTTLTGRPA